MKIRSFFLICIAIVGNLSCSQQPLHQSLSCPDVSIQTAAISESANQLRTQRKKNKKKKNKCNTDCCWKYTTRITGCMNVALFLTTVSAVLYFRDAVPQLVSTCEQADTAVNEALPYIQEIINNYPGVSKAAEDAVTAINDVRPYIERLPEIEKSIKKIDEDVQTLIDDARNCTQAIDNKKAAAIKRRFEDLQKELGAAHTASKEIKAKNNTLHSAMGISSKVPQLDVQRMNRKQKFKRVNR